MNALLIFIVMLVLIAITGIACWFFICSIREKEYRAAVFGGVQFGLFLSTLVFFFILSGSGFFNTGLGVMSLIVALIHMVVFVWIFFRRTGLNARTLKGTAGLILGEVNRFDRRKSVFYRNRLEPDTQAYTEYYEKYPEWEEQDAKRRTMGGTLGNMGAIDKPYGNINRSATIATGALFAHFSKPYMIHPRKFTKKSDMSPEEASCRVKGFAYSLGADLVGITSINPLWTYSHLGGSRQHQDEDRDKPLEMTNTYAVVFATEMAFDLVNTGPHTPTDLEASRNYAEGAYIATGLAQFIANLGYSATAEQVNHYQTLMVPLAVDAGLGEVGRHGYLITKELGSRLRLAGVTTDLPLVPDKPVDIGAFDFCTVCKKCADCCPSGSISEDDPSEYNGTLRWKLNAETCFEYWAKVGTGCNICMRVCPWSHDKTFPHRLITEMVSRNKFSRRLFLHMDDLFYGRKPKAKAAPRWAWYGPYSE